MIVRSGAIDSSLNVKRSCSVITSDSIRCTSVMGETRREPSSNRSRWTIRSSADETCCRIARTGRSYPAISTIVSMRWSASRGEFAWTVDIDPSWPVFIAWSMSSASAPRTSPTMIRSGRMRSELRTSSRIAISPSPSMFLGRASSRSTCSWCSWSSAASSIVTIRSASGIADESAFSSVVLPVPVPPEMRMLSSRGDAGARNVDGLGADRAEIDHVVEREALLRELADRDERAGQRQRRDDHVDAAAVREARVDHRRRLVDATTDLRHHLVDDAAQVRVVVEAHGRLEQPALALDPDVPGAVDHDLRDRVVGEQALERAVAEDVVGDLLAEALAVVARERRLAGEMPSDVHHDALAQRGGVHRDVEQLGPELADHGQVDPRLQLCKRLARALRRRRPGRRQAFMEFHLALPPE